MPGPLLQLGATVQCGHGGVATPLVPNPRVLLSGQPAVAISSPFAIAGCPSPSPPGTCVTGQMMVPATRILMDGQPALLQTSTGTCVPTGAPLLVIVAQPRV